MNYSWDSNLPQVLKKKKGVGKGEATHGVLLRKSFTHCPLLSSVGKSLAAKRVKKSAKFSGWGCRKGVENKNRSWVVTIKTSGLLGHRREQVPAGKKSKVYERGKVETNEKNQGVLRE